METDSPGRSRRPVACRLIEPKSPNSLARMALDPTGTDWTADELTLIVADYFAMLQAELAGVAYSKAEHRRGLLGLIRRSEGSIEFKHQNISAVLQELGLPWIKGYKPRSNYQGNLFAAIERELAANPQWLESVPGENPVREALDSIFVPPPVRSAEPSPLRELARLIRRFDPAARDARNRKLGKAGEEFVLNVERQRLRALGYDRLADRIKWIAQDEGDGAGYDILSFDASGAERLLEVKTTCGTVRTPFFVTRNELSLSQERPAEFRLVRVHQFANDPKIFVLEPPLSDHVQLEPTAYQARWS
jgi:hypothetical protein